METPEYIQVKFMSSSDVIQTLEKELNNSPEQVKILSSGPEKDPTLLEFGLIEWAAVAAIVQGVFYVGELSIKLYKYLKENENKNKRIIIQTPLGRTEFVASEKLSEEEIRDALLLLAGVHK